MLATHKFSVAMRFTLSLSFVVAIAVTLLTGCAGYQLGPTNGMAAGSKSIQVNPFQNKTEEPRLTEYVNNAIRKRLQQDGTYSLDTHGDGDIIINGIITKYDRLEVGLNPTDTRTVQDYVLTMTAQLTVTERSTGKVLLDRPVTGRSEVHAGSDFPSSERQAVPQMAENMARVAVSYLAEGTW